MTKDNYEFMNGFNACVEQMIKIINTEMHKSRNSSSSIFEALLSVKHEVLSKHYNGNVRVSEFEKVPTKDAVCE